MAHAVQDCDCYHCKTAREADAHHLAVLASQKKWAAERAKHLAFPAEFIERHGGKDVTVKLNVTAPDGTGLGPMAVFPDGCFCHPTGRYAFKEDFNTPEEKAWQAALVLAYTQAKVRAGTTVFAQLKEALAANPYATEEAIAGLERFAEQVKTWKRKANVAKVMHQRALDRAHYPGLSLGEIAARKKAAQAARETFEAEQAAWRDQQTQRIAAINIKVENETPQEELDAVAKAARQPETVTAPPM